jgi:cell wall-associated NlpC family hydrolase
MPRTTSQQILQGHPIKRSELKSGDLVFFRKGSHVGIYLEDDKFLHVSTKIGVTISSMHNSYWSRYFWQAVRVKPVITISP